MTGTCWGQSNRWDNIHAIGSSGVSGDSQKHKVVPDEPGSLGSTHAVGGHGASEDPFVCYQENETERLLFHCWWRIFVYLSSVSLGLHLPHEGQEPSEFRTGD